MALRPHVEEREFLKRDFAYACNDFSDLQPSFCEAFIVMYSITDCDSVAKYRKK